MRLALVGERRAISLFSLGFYATLFMLSAIGLGGAWAPFFGALAATYALAFFALGAEWFWARWFAMGLGVSGMTLALLGLVQIGWEPGLAVWGGMHLLMYAPLLGEGMAARYEGQTAWRERWGVSEQSVASLRRAVHGAGTGLPTLIVFALAPRQSQAAAVLLVALAAVGLFGLVRLRFWGVAALGAAGFGAGVLVLSQPTCPAVSDAGTVLVSLAGVLSAAFLAWAVSPFVLPAYRFLRAGR